MPIRKTLFSPFRVVFCFIAMSLACGLALPRLSVNLLPGESSSTLTIFYSLPNSSPDIVEKQITSLVEDACSSLDQLKKILSVSNNNSGYVQLQFDQSADMQFRQLEVASIIRRLYPQLPATASYPVITGDYSNDGEKGPMLVYYINAPLQPFQIRKEAEDVFHKVFAGMQEIKQVNMSGADFLQLVIRFDHIKCEAWQLQPAGIISSIQSYFSSGYPGTFTEENGEEYFLRIPSPATSDSAIENILLPVNNGQMIHLKDIASVHIEEQDAAGYFRINGKNCIAVSMYAREGANKIVVEQKVKKLIPQALLMLPGYDIRPAYNDTRFIKKEINKNYRRAALSISILIFFVLFFYRSWRYTVNLFLGLAVSFSFTIILTWLFGINIHVYTIAALAVCFGIMTDNIIVMLDYYHQWRNRKIFPSLLGGALMTIASLSMVFLLPEQEKKNLADFSILIILSLVCSLVTLYGFTPGLYELTSSHKPLLAGVSVTERISFAGKRKRAVTGSYYFSMIRFIVGFRKLFFAGLVLAFGLPFFLLPAQWKGNHWYHHAYNNIIGSEKYQQHIQPYTGKWLGGTLWLFLQGVYTKSSYRSPEQTKLYIQARMSFGSTAQQVNVIFRNIENFLTGAEGIDTYVTSIEGRSGKISITFRDDIEKTILPVQLKSELISRTANVGGVEWDIYGMGQGFSNTDDQGVAGYRLIMKGYNYNELEKQANLLKQKLFKQQRIQKIDINKSAAFDEEESKEYVIDLEANRIALYNTNRQEILNKLLNLSEPNAPATQIAIGDRYYPLVLKEKDADKFSAYHLLHAPLFLDPQRTVSLGLSGHNAIRNTVSAISKEDRQYLRFISFDYMGSSDAGNKYVAGMLNEMNKQMPIGYSIQQQNGQQLLYDNDNRYMLIVLLIGLNFFICCVLFESLKKAFYVICMIPVSFIGLFLTFANGQFYFDQGGYAAFVMLGGLVSNASIYIIHDFKKLCNNKPTASPNKLLIRATVNRSRTLVLTILSTLSGLIPFILEGQQQVFWFSFALGTFVGLLFSLFALFVVLPVLLWTGAKSDGTSGPLG